MNEEMSFEQLTTQVKSVHEAQALMPRARSISFLWLETVRLAATSSMYEQNGRELAEYGSKLLTYLAEKLNIKSLDRQMLTFCRIFYLKYPQIKEIKDMGM